jgi:hypothetical protein
MRTDPGPKGQVPYTQKFDRLGPLQESAHPIVHLYDIHEDSEFNFFAWRELRPDRKDLRQWQYCGH